MATLVEVTQKKPVLETITLKLNRTEISDLKTFMDEWYGRNYSFGGQDRAKQHTVYQAITKAESGKADAEIVKVAAKDFF